VSLTIHLVDYIGQSSTDRRPVGHASQALKDLRDLLSGWVTAAFVLPRNYGEFFPDLKSSTAFELRYFCDVDIRSPFCRIRCLFGKVRNLLHVFLSGKGKILWFMNVDFLFFIFLVLFPLSRKTTVISTLYLQEYGQGSGRGRRIKNHFLRRGLKKVDLVVKSNSAMFFSGRNVFCPDYIYRRDMFPMQSEKKTYLLCAGLMNQAKEVEKLASVCCDAKIPLKIAGFFPDKKLLKKVEKHSGGSVEVVDRYFAEEEFRQMVSGAEFLVIPYREENYDRRTSGIFLESIYADTVPVAPEFLTRFMNLPAVEYDRLENLPVILRALNKGDLENLRKKMGAVRERYSLKRVRVDLCAALDKVLPEHHQG
jgi:hypothetical protein